MVMVLPHEDDGLADVEASLTAHSVDDWVDALYDNQVQVTIPTFEMRFAQELRTVLEALGMGIAFQPGAADFSGITDTGMYISKVIHEAYVLVDEEGTEAAAASAVTMQDMAISEPLTFHADHPFLFFIRDDLTGSILFMGRVVDPSAG